MQSERRAIRAFLLPDAKTRSGAGKFFCKFIFLKSETACLAMLTTRTNWVGAIPFFWDAAEKSGGKPSSGQPEQRPLTGVG